MSQLLSSAFSSIREKIVAADHVLLALDFDGTLAPIATAPELVTLPRATAQALNVLARCPSTTVAIISGRSLPDLAGFLGEGLVMAGDHGLEIAGPGISFVHPGATMGQPAVDRVCGLLAERFAGVPGVLIERKRFSATIHFRNAPLETVPWIGKTVHLAAAPYHSDLRVERARKAWELRPRVDWNKGSALRFVWRTIKASAPVIVCAGDDATDEDMFAVSDDAVSIKVGVPGRTAAHYHVSGPGAIGEFLWTLAGILIKKQPLLSADREHLRAG